MQNKTSSIFPIPRAAGRLPGRLRGNRHAAILGLLFVTSFVVHATAAARTVTFSDSGDFLMGIKAMGNVHGPGYPLYLMTAKLFSWLVPFGSLAFRVSLYTGLLASVTACLVYWIVYRLTHSRIGGVAAGLAFAFSYTFFYQSVIPETYSLSTLLLAIMIIMALRWERMLHAGRKESADNALCIFALALGLGLANHFSVLFILPAFFFFAVDTNWREAFAPRNLVRMIAFFAIGLLPYLYIPVAAFRGPAYNYGDPSTLIRWFHHMTAYYQRGGLFGYPYRFLPGRLGRYFSSLTTEFPYFWWLVPLGFLASLGKRNKKYPVFLLFLFLLALLPVMTYAQIEPVLRAHFYNESYMIVSLWIGFGVAFLVWLVRRVFERADRLVEYAAIAAVSCIALLCPLSALVIHYDKVDKSDYTYARDMARDMLTTADRDGVIIVDDDNVIFPLMYTQVDEKLRTDVRVVSAISAGVPGFQGSDLLSYTPPGYVSLAGNDLYTQLIDRNFGRLPVYTTVPNIIHYDWNSTWLGFLVRVSPGGSVGPAVRPGATRLPGADTTAYKDSDARSAIQLPDALKASVLYGRKDYPGAGAIYSNIIPNFQKNIYVPTLYSCGSYSELYDIWGDILNLQRRYNDTISSLSKATVIDPDYYSTTLARAYSSVGRYADALNEFDKYLAFQPNDSSARTDLADTYIKINDYHGASAELKRVLSVDQSNQRAHLLYARVLFNEGSGAEARRELEKTINLDPASDEANTAREYLKRLSQ